MMNKMPILKFSLDVFGEMMGLRLAAFQSVLTLKKGTRTYNFNSFYTKCLGQKKNNTLCPHHSLLRQQFKTAYDNIKKSKLLKIL